MGEAKVVRPRPQGGRAGRKKQRMTKTIIHPQIGEVTLSTTARSVRITLSVRPDGRVRLSYPGWVTQRRALAFLETKCDWVAAARTKMERKYPVQPPREPVSPAQRAEAKRVLPEMVARLAARHGLSYGAVRVRATRSRWGSCTARGDINLSVSLLKLPTYLAEYVVLHELCHTVHHDHSERFHALLDRVTDGHHRNLARELRAYRP